MAMMVCAAIRQEIFKTKIGEEADKKFTDFLKHKFVHWVDVDYPISDLAGRLGEYYNIGAGKLPNREMTDLDAQHLAAAIVYNVDAFYTFDEGKKGGMNLLALNGDVMGYPLTIIKPPLPPQMKLPLPGTK